MRVRVPPFAPITMANVESLGTLERRVSMALAADEIERKGDERLKRLARSVRMPGFRPGKVPLKLIAQTYGSQVRSEVLADAVQKAFTDAVKEANLKVAGYPKFENTKDLEFSATFEVYPEVKVGDIAAATIERPDRKRHTSELQSPCNLVCRLLLEKDKEQLLVDEEYFDEGDTVKRLIP